MALTQQVETETPPTTTETREGHREGPLSIAEEHRLSRRWRPSH